VRDRAKSFSTSLAQNGAIRPDVIPIPLRFFCKKPQTASAPELLAPPQQQQQHNTHIREKQFIAVKINFTHSHTHTL
jgi:hypothetical protein